MSLLVQTTGFLCPVVAAALCAAGRPWPKPRPIVILLAVASIAAPFIGMWTITQGILEAGSASIGAVSAGLSETLLTLPFAWGAGLALATITVPRETIRRYRITMIGLAILATVCLLVNASAIQNAFSVTTTGAGGHLRGFGAWLVEIVRQ